MKKIVIGIVIGIIISMSSIYAKQIQETIQISYNDIKISIYGEEYIPTNVNGNIVEPFIYDGTTYVPIRAVSQAFGKKVEWNDKEKTVEIEPPFSIEEISQSKQVINNFFEYFSVGKNTEMKSLVSGNLSSYDFSEQVYGMKNATLSQCNYMEESSNLTTNTLVFYCSFKDVDFHPQSVNNSDNTEKSFYIIVKKEGSEYIIDDFVTGL